MENLQGLALWWRESDFVVSTVFILLVVLSLLSWTVMIYKAWQFWRLERLERQVVTALRGRGDSDEMAQWLARDTLSCLALKEALGLSPECREGGQLARIRHLEHHAQRFIHEQRVELESYLTGLATIGNSAPFIGLLGTVWGIMNALQGLGEGEQLSMDVVTGPIGEALVATALGLFVAIPAVVAYNLLLRRLRQLSVLTDSNLYRLIQLTAAGRG